MKERDWPAFGLNYLHPAWSTSILCTCGIAGETTKYSLTFVPHALYTSLFLRGNCTSTTFNQRNWRWVNIYFITWSKSSFKYLVFLFPPLDGMNLGTRPFLFASKIFQSLTSLFSTNNGTHLFFFPKISLFTITLPKLLHFRNH